MKDSGIVEEMTKLKFDTPWEEYPNRVRALIGSTAARLLDRRHGTAIITSPTASKTEKSRVFEFASQYLLGKSAEYLRGDKNCIFCKVSSVEDYVLSIENDFAVLADKIPLTKNHLLIISRDHVRTMGDLKKEQLVELSDLVECIEGFFMSLGKKTLMFETGFIGQSIPHAHIHFIPDESFHLEEGLRAMKLEIIELLSLTQLEEFCKKNGGYILWRQDSKTFVASTEGKELSESFFRSIIAQQLGKHSIANWKECEQNPDIMEKSKAMVQTLKNNWRKTKV